MRARPTTKHELTLHPFLGQVVPFERVEDATGNLGEGVHDVGAERHVDILREVLHASWAVLRPVGVVAHHFHIGGGHANEGHGGEDGEEAAHLDFEFFSEEKKYI